MTQKNILKILVIMIAVLSLFAVSCRKASTSPEPTPTPTPSGNPTVFTVTAGTSSPIRIIKDTDFKAYADGNIGAKVGGTSDYSVTIKEVKAKSETEDVVLDASDFTVDKNTIKLSDAGIGKFSGKNLTEKQAKEYTLTLTYSTTANVEPKSREITTDIGIVQNHLLTKQEFTDYVKKWKWQANSTAQANEGNIYVNSSDGNSSVQFQVNAANFSATDKTRNYSISGNGSGTAYSKANALNIFASAAKKDDNKSNPTSTGYESYFSDIKGLKTVDSDSLNKMTLYLQFILNDDTALIDTELTHITNANEGLSFELSLTTSNDTWQD
ncbi:hypothetical protein EPJ64_06245 [Brachyspira aalborgi]|uniref:DUF5105 domain-containing protein n=1 Tax=Brachyspira aalborgi TaxID=29522 RepID=A0AB38Q0D2_9SPIR|nr:hypothetical protein [Brachyspira aalborgi]TXJ14301.1 hypothetical protein EPJ77_10890 [Brachyspira aalborgi]TXJ19079.1 hypothetical protein EPJ64_06245 [Brachyspira aalborgi]TXJ25205.1 hypothetical protein EPJ73_06975 [Brachyspira aalborgi]TXJ47212.1 hypothetical protein EPJ75_10895 [Brachyspira aalborgi]